MMPEKKSNLKSKTLQELDEHQKKKAKTVEFNLNGGDSPKKAAANTVSFQMQRIARGPAGRKMGLALASMVLLCVVFKMESLVASKPQKVAPTQAYQPAVNARKVHSEPKADRWMQFIDQQLSESVEEREWTIKELVQNASPGTLRSMDMFLRVHEPEAISAPIISENYKPMDEEFMLHEKDALLHADGEEQHHVFQEMIKKSEPELHASVLKYVKSYMPHQDRFMENDATKINQPENFTLFTKEDWASIKKEMREINQDCEEVLKMAANVPGDAGKMLKDVVDSFIQIQRVRAINPENPHSRKVHYWNSHQAKVEKFQKEINAQHSVTAKRELFAKHKSVVKNEWEIFIESIVRTKLSNSLRQPELETTIGDNLKAIKAHPEFPQKAKDILEVIFRKQFMSVGSKLRFMSWSTLENASGDMEGFASVVVGQAGN
jgi:ElaB/YqjD/DUF883 family membrane-anchored ribosome-binding protein